MFFCTIEIAERRQSKNFMNFSHQRARLSFAISMVDFTKVTLNQNNLSFKKKEYIVPPLQLYVNMLVGKHVQDEKLTDFPDFCLKR